MSEILQRDLDGVRILTLNRPERLNAFTPTGYRDLRLLLESADSSTDIKSIVLEGGRRAFSTGADLSCLEDEASMEAMKREFGQLIDTLIDLSTPLVAAAAGAIVGFGATLLLHCDVVLLASDARLRFPFTELGTVPEAASSWLLPNAVGIQRATELIMSARWLTAAQAVDMGLAARSVPYDDLQAGVLKLARQIAATPGASARMAKALLREPLRQQLKRAVRLEGEAAATLADALGPPATTTKRRDRDTGQP